MTVRCARCGGKVPKKRLLNEKGSQYAGFFCSTACHIEYADEMIGIFRTSEQEAQEELQAEVAEGHPWTRQVLQDIDSAAAEATLEGQRPQEIAARFLGKVAGKFATNLYAKFEQTAKTWAESKKAAAEGQPEPEPEPARKNGRRAERNGKWAANGQRHGPSASGRQPAQPSQPPPPAKPHGPPPGTQRKPDPNNPTGEPADLEDLPFEDQRMWLLRRFTFLKPNPTWDEVTKEWRKLSLKYHPDNKKTGNTRLAALVNSTYQRLGEIKTEIGWPTPTPAPTST